MKFAIYLMLSVGFISAMAMSLKNKKGITFISATDKASMVNTVEKNDDPSETKKKLDAGSYKSEDIPDMAEATAKTA